MEKNELNFNDRTNEYVWGVMHRLYQYVIDRGSNFLGITLNTRHYMKQIFFYAVVMPCLVQ